MTLPTSGAEAWTAELRRRLDELLDEYRVLLQSRLDGLTERHASGASKMTLLALVKHVADLVLR